MPNCLQNVRIYKTPNNGCSGIEELGLKPGDNQTHLKAAGETFSSSTLDYEDAQNQQRVVTEDGPVPLSASQE